MFGIENLKKLVKFACDFTKQAASSLADGWQWTDAFAFVDEMASIPGVIKSLPAVKQEIADLSAEERTELFNYLAEEFDIPNDKTEAFIEHSVAFAISALALVEEWKSLKAA